ncbi:glycosyltransferase family 4 protein [Treponema sp.]|uniref:glycosyltransferase family 4 protein n=1 Tax=Treponema sp. TaxID=166 RepID=UPI00388DC3AB
MRIIQIVPSLSYGDAVGNDILALKKIIEQKGIETAVYAESVNIKAGEEDSIFTISDLKSLSENDILISHVACSSQLNEDIKHLRCLKIMMYHNITPPHFFKDYNVQSQKSCEQALKEVESLKSTFDLVLTPSEFNKKDLLRMGFSCPIRILPILIPFDDYKKTPAEHILKQYNDNFTNIIFTGRIAPNKKHEDVLKVFYEYQRYFNEKSRLFFVGSSSSLERYEQRLRDYAGVLGVKNVIFTGHVRFEEILAYYKVSDLFLCQSEHEGFCVPLVEAMFFEKPVVAYDSSAISETLGGSGFILKEKNSVKTAAVMNRILTDDELRKTIIENQNIRLSDFEYEKIAGLFWQYMAEFLES